MSDSIEPSAPSRPLNRDVVAIPDEIPLLPVKNTAAFPGTIMPLTVVRQKSQRLLDSVLVGDKLIGVVAQRSDKIDDPNLNDLYRIGTVCQILKLLKLPDNTQTIIVHGLCRFGIESLTQVQPFWKAKVSPYWDDKTIGSELEAIMNNVRHAAGEVIQRSPNVPEEALQVLSSIDEPGGLADFLGANLSLGLVHKQELLETFSVKDRLLKVNVALASQLEVLQLSEKIQTQVHEQIDKTQREYFLHEQMKAIRKELGEEEGDLRASEIAKLEEKIEQAQMPPAVQTEARRELKRMNSIPQASPEYSVALDYINWLCELPWSVSTPDRLDIKKAAQILDEDHYDLESIKKRILEFLAVRKLKPEGKGPILCFIGPPGVGKTSLGQSIARSMGRKFIRMSLGGVRDEAELRGHRRTYIGSLPGRVIQEMRKCGSNNPVFMLDEVDKLGSDFRGDPSSALLEVLDPQQNHSFTDHYLSVPFNLSRVLFIATANYMDMIPPALRDRMEVMELDGYTQGEKLHIAKTYLIPRQIEENGLKKGAIRFQYPAIQLVISGYTREAGVRNLEREIGTICRRMAVEFASTKRHKQVQINEKEVSQYLGPVQFESEVALRTSTPGVVTGLAYTPVGGDILFIEASKMPGNGNLTLTGQVGSVMKESAHAGFSLIRSHAEKWDIQEKDLASVDMHIHVPAGAIPKDGPSAGIAMTTAMVSILKNQKVRNDIAMTGEITLRGIVLPVGGIKQKVLSAYRAGIKSVILPARNKKDLVDVPEEVLKKLSFKFVSHIDEVLPIAFLSLNPKTAKSSAAAKLMPKKSSGKKSKHVGLQKHVARDR